MTYDGTEAIVDTTTDVEGDENNKLMWYMAANLQTDLKVAVKSPYQPIVKGKPFRGEFTRDTPR